MDLYFEPDQVDVYDSGAAEAEALVSGGAAVVFGSEGPPGATGFMDVGFGFENFSAGQRLRGVALAHEIDASDSVSVAYTATPPTNIDQVVGLFDNGAQIGNATWLVGESYGTIATGNHTLLRRDFPEFVTPNPLDPAFSHFAVTYAGPAGSDG